MSNRVATFVMKLVDRVSAPAKIIARGSASIAKGFQIAKRKLSEFIKAGEKARPTFSGLGSVMRNAFAGLAIGAAITGITKLQAQVEGLDRAIEFASGKDAAANLSTLNGTIDRLGLNAIATKEGYTTLLGSFKDTALQGKPARDVFVGVSSAVSALNLSGEQAKGTYLALGQIMSKGKVQAEELRGQLGERIPGAFQIAARAMGMTTQELDKQLSTGKVLAEDFLPKFAAELQNTFGPAAQANAQSLEARLNRMGNAFLYLKLKAFNVLEPFINEGIRLGTIFLQMLIPALNETKRLFGVIGAFVQKYSVTIGAVVAVLGAYFVVTKSIVVVTRAWAAVQAVLTALFAASGIPLIIGLIAALAAGIIYAYTQVDSFRGTLWGLWSAAKEVFSSIGRYAKALGNILLGAVTMDGDLIRKGVQDFKNVGNDFGKAFTKGYEQGVKNKPKMPAFLKQFTEGPGGTPVLPLSGGLPTTSTPAGTSDAITSSPTNVSGGSGRIVNTSIDKIEVNVAVADSLGLSLNDIADEVARVIVGSVRDSELALSYG